ncbi:MAG: HD domain-containing protein, partial [Planctomycetia bacterium]
MIIQLCDMKDGENGDFFALLTSKEQLTTREGKPYFRVGFRDGEREVNFPIWSDAPWAAECKDEWTPGCFYKIRATYRETNYGPQLDIQRIREINDDDLTDGFDPGMCLPRSRFEPQSMYDELLTLVREHVENGPLRTLVETILQENRESMLTSPAARGNHHAYQAGLLEHTLSVTRTCVYLAQKYSEYYPEMSPPLDRSLVVAGAVLHDIGKLRELEAGPVATQYTAEGELVGHILQGRDMVREAAAEIKGLDPEVRLRLE